MSFDSSSTPDTHPDWHDLLAGYALDDLSPEERTVLTKILAERPDLNAELLAYQETLAMVPYALDPKPLPADLEKNIVAAAQRTAPPPSQKRWPRLFRRHGLLAAAAAILIVIAGDNYRLRQQQANLKTRLETAKTELQEKDRLAQANQNEPDYEPVIDILRQPDALVYSLQGTGEALTSSGSLLTLPNHSEVQLVSHNLPVLPAGQVYRLWAVSTQESDPMFCGEFNNTKIGNVQWQVPNALCNATPFKVIITVDAVADPPVPKGPAVLMSSAE
ncbi:MAG: anti-sigma factor [Cyanobacteria bacterium P01_D01_bin.2]